MANSVINQETSASLDYRHLKQDEITFTVWNKAAENEFGRLDQGVGGRIEGSNTILQVKYLDFQFLPFTFIHFFVWNNPFLYFVEHSIFIFCGTIHSYILWNVFSDFCGMRQNFWPGFPKCQTPLYWSSKECSSIIRVKFSPLVQMVLLQRLSKRSDPKSVGGILYYGK
jgi:hypothetical protein